MELSPELGAAKGSDAPVVPLVSETVGEGGGGLPAKGSVAGAVPLTSVVGLGADGATVPLTSVTGVLGTAVAGVEVVSGMAGVRAWSSEIGSKMDSNQC